MGFLAGHREDEAINFGFKAPGDGEKCIKCKGKPAGAGLDYCHKCGREKFGKVVVVEKKPLQKQRSKPKHLTELQRQEVIRLYREANGKHGTQRRLAILFNVSSTTIHKTLFKRAK